MSYPMPEGSSRPSVRHTLPHRTLPRLRLDLIFYRVWDATKKFPLLTVDKEGMVAAVIWTHRVREAMSESLHRFDWGQNVVFFQGLIGSTALKKFVWILISESIRKVLEMLKNQMILLKTLCWPVCRGLNVDNEAWIRWRLSINEIALDLADDIFTQLEGITFIILWISPAFYAWVNLFRSPPRWQTNLVQRESPRSESVLFWHSQPEFPSQRVSEFYSCIGLQKFRRTMYLSYILPNTSSWLPWGVRPVQPEDPIKMLPRMTCSREANLLSCKFT